MLNKNQFWLLTLLAAAGVVLVFCNMLLFTQNRATQAEAASRAQYIQQSAQLENLYREMVKALADLSVRNSDSDLRDMLAKQGITMNPPGGGQAPMPMPSPAPDATKGTK